MAEIQSNPIPPFKTKPKRWSLPDLVLKNASSLYVVQIGRKLIPLASIPFLARVLRPEGWGQAVFVIAMAELMAIFIEFGFGLSATRSLAHHRDDPFERGKIATGVLCAQGILGVSAIAVSLIAALFIPLLRERPALLVCGLLYALAQGFSPLWYFQGMERIRLAALIEMSSKVAALGALFVFVKGPADVWRAIAIQALSPAVLAMIGIPLALLTSRPCRPQWGVMKAVLEDGWKMFVFRSTESLYGVANAFLLGLFASPASVGYFAAAEKISKAAAGLVNPIRESLYPRINHLIHRDREEAARLAKVGAALMIGMGVLLSAALYIFAGSIIRAFMGAQFEPAVRVLTILAPLPLLLSITFASGQLWLLPSGKDQTVLRVVFSAAMVNLALAFPFSHRWGHIGMACTVLLSELLVAGSLLWNVLRHGPGSLLHTGSKVATDALPSGSTLSAPGSYAATDLCVPDIAVDTEKERVAYVIPVFKAQQEFEHTMRSLAASATACTVFVVDDGSPAPVAVADYGTQITVHLIRLKHHSGIVAALNTGVEAAITAGYEYIARIDAGDFSAPHRLARQIDYLKSHPRCMLVGCDAEVRNEDSSYCFTIEPPRDPAVLARALHERAWLLHPGVMFRTPVFREVGMYSSAYEAAEDYELFLRIAKTHEVGVVPEPLLIYVRHKGSISARKSRTQLISRLRLLLVYFQWTSWMSYYGVLRTFGSLLMPTRAKNSFKERFLYSRLGARPGSTVRRAAMELRTRL